MVSFARSILDQREPQGIRGKWIVRDRLAMMRPSPFSPPGQPVRNKAASSLKGTTCCCGSPPCADPCTSSDCDYCNGRDELSIYTTSEIYEKWDQGTAQQPPCNTLNTCPGTPAPCVDLDVTASYQGGTRIQITDVSLASPVLLGQPVSCAFGNLDPPYKVLDKRLRVSGVRGNLPGCAIIENPRDETSQFPFLLYRCDGGFNLEDLGGANPPTLCASDCVGGNQCTARDCTAFSTLHDLLCALLPHDCDNVDIAIDTGCVQQKSNQQLYCTFERIRWNVQIGITRN